MRATGMELDDISLAAARARGFAVVHGVLPDQAAAMADGCDVVFSMHVIEHVPQPWVVLTALSSLLRPGGVMLLGIPDQSSLPSTIKKVLLRCGLHRGIMDSSPRPYIFTVLPSRQWGYGPSGCA